MKPRIAVVDAENRFVRWTDRAEIHSKHLAHRSVQVFIFDSEGRLVLQKRHADKMTFPGHWDISCSGHVEEPDYKGDPDRKLNAVYRGAAHRELKEELGIEPDLEFLGAFSPEPGIHYEHLHLFEGVHDGPYNIQEDEVEAVVSVTPDEYDAMVQAPDVDVTFGLVHFVRWLREQGRFVAE